MSARVLSLVALMIACTFAQIACARESAPRMTVSWLDRCGDTAQRPYFEIEVYSDRYRYRGGPGMREQGEITRRLRPAESQRLLSEIATYIDEAPARYAKIEGKGEEPETYCIAVHSDAERFEVGDVSALVGGSTNAQANSELRRLEQVITRTIDFKKWACPAHGYDLLLNAFCGTPAIYFSFTEDEPCGYRHYVQVYDNGDLQYFSVQDRSVDERRKLGRRKLRKLLEVARSFGPSDMVPQLVPDNAHYVPRGTYSDPRTIEFFRTTIATIADIEWRKLSGPPRKCFRGTRVNPTYPQGTLIVQMQ